MPAKDNAVYIATPLKNDKLVLMQAKFKEELGVPFELTAEMLSEDTNGNSLKLKAREATL